MKTSLKLAKLFAENGCELDYRFYYLNGKLCSSEEREFTDPELYLAVFDKERGDLAPAYDILNDLCVKYAKEVFGGKTLHIQGTDTGFNEQLQLHTCNILQLLQQGKQEEAEQYLWEHCLDNPKNK
jgi:hypothetical protein